MKEKIALDIPRVVEYQGERWSVGKVNLRDNTLNIYRSVLVIRGASSEFWDIETKTISVEELYKSDDQCAPVKIVKEW